MSHRRERSIADAARDQLDAESARAGLRSDRRRTSPRAGPRTSTRAAGGSRRASTPPAPVDRLAERAAAERQSGRVFDPELVARQQVETVRRRIPVRRADREAILHLVRRALGHGQLIVVPGQHRPVARQLLREAGGGQPAVARRIVPPLEASRALEPCARGVLRGRPRPPWPRVLTPAIGVEMFEAGGQPHALGDASTDSASQSPPRLRGRKWRRPSRYSLKTSPSFM